MSPFPSQIILCVILLFAGQNTGCGDPPRSALAAPFPAMQPAVASTELKIEEVTLDPMIIIGYRSPPSSTTLTPHISTSESGDIVLDETPIKGALLEIISAESEDEACKTAVGFLVVPTLPATGVYSDCKDPRSSLYTMKVVNCSKDDITFTTFNFILSLDRVEEVAGLLKGGFELFIASDSSNNVGVVKLIDDKSAMVSFPLEGTAVTIGAGKEEFCEFRATRPCLTVDRPPQFNLDLIGAWASKGDDEDEYVSGAVFEKSDRLVTFLSRD